MPITGMDPAGTRVPGRRNMDAGLLLIGIGAIMLLVSLFLEWYEPNAEAWDVFEVWDLVLAALAIAALVAVAGRLGFGPPRPAAWLIGASLGALVIVLYALIDPPPVAEAIATNGGDFGDPSTGLWLALAAAVLMTAGTLLSVARISIAISAAGRDHPSPAGPASARPVDPAGSNPAVPQPPDVAQTGYGAGSVRSSGRFTRDAPSADPDPADTHGSIPPTEPTRRL
jgi:pimeloyl-ACP methyl ester carboxylesterase